MDVRRSEEDITDFSETVEQLNPLLEMGKAQLKAYSDAWNYVTGVTDEATAANQRAKFERGEVEAPFRRLAPAAQQAATYLGSADLAAANLARPLAMIKGQSDATSAPL